MTANIRITVPDKLKQEAEGAFKAMGLDMSSGIKMYLAQVVKDQRIPFQVTSNTAVASQESTRMDDFSYNDSKGNESFSVRSSQSNNKPVPPPLQTSTESFTRSFGPYAR